MNLCVAYPKLTSPDASLIRDFRRQHDKNYVDVIDALTLCTYDGSKVQDLETFPLSQKGGINE